MRDDASVVPETDAIARNAAGGLNRDDEGRLVTGCESEKVDISASAGDERALLIEQEHDGIQLFECRTRDRIPHQAGQRKATPSAFVPQRHELQGRLSSGRRCCCGRSRTAAIDSPVSTAHDDDEENDGSDGEIPLTSARRRG